MDPIPMYGWVAGCPGGRYVHVLFSPLHSHFLSLGSPRGRRGGMVVVTGLHGLWLTGLSARVVLPELFGLSSAPGPICRFAYLWLDVMLDGLGGEGRHCEGWHSETPNTANSFGGGPGACEIPHGSHNLSRCAYCPFQAKPHLELEKATSQAETPHAAILRVQSPCREVHGKRVRIPTHACVHTPNPTHTWLGTTGQEARLEWAPAGWTQPAWIGEGELIEWLVIECKQSQLGQFFCR
mmetsp:Transcript_76288/g.134666  ORF Transcript_76288/g.134666 Transcript_76288/m.134666 type:complete len:238 (-) Transcript_76288:723-1436(-)